MEPQGKEEGGRMTWQILKQINNVDFGIINSVDEQKEMIELKTVHGDILVVKGAVEDDPNALMTFGIIEGEKKARIAFYKPIHELEQMISEKE